MIAETGAGDWRSRVVRSVGLPDTPWRTGGARTTRWEAIAARSLRAVLAPLGPGARIEPSDAYEMFQSSLEYFLPQQLGWRHESFDGFWFADARKTGTGTAEFAGLAILITSQKWTPIHLRIGLAPETDRVRTLDCRVGERCGARPGVVRIKYRSPAAPSYLEALPARIGQVAWMWRATRKPGLRRPIRRRGSPRCV